VKNRPKISTANQDGAAADDDSGAGLGLIALARGGFAGIYII
jgi:hypothetical protein